jgi:hypothetical protein
MARHRLIAALTTSVLALAACSPSEATDQDAARPGSVVIVQKPAVTPTSLPEPTVTPTSVQKPTVTPTSPKSASATPTGQAGHPYVGMWVTADGQIRQELTAGGRYDEARGTRESAYTGSYSVAGNQIDYVDDTGFTADGTFVDADTLHHGGMIFYRER